MTLRLALAALLLGAGPAQQRPAAPPLAEEKERIVTGLALALENASGRDVRDARVAALYVPAGSAPSPFLAPGPLKAVFEGFVSVDLGTECVFSAEGSGALSITINGKPALDARGPDLSKAEGKPVMLKKGRNRFVATFESPEKGDATVRVFWSSTDFAREPISPRELSYDLNAKPVRSQRRVREGRELVASRRCLKCHVHEARGMPELDMDAPSLADAGARLGTGWMARWILDPRSLRPEATMPRLPGLTPQDAADLAAYLGTLGTPAPEKPSSALAKEGGALFSQFRCIGCHTLPDKASAPDRIPLSYVREKWQPAALAAFLKKPDRHYAWIEMPTFGLSDDEASRLAAFLLSRGADLPKSPLPPGDAARGKSKVETAGCLNCHVLPLTNAFKTAPLKDIPAGGWARGCLSDAEDAKGPRHSLSGSERAAIRSFAATDLSSLSRDAAPEFAARQIRALRCAACHKRDDRQDLWGDVADEAKDLLPPKKVDDNAEFAEQAPAEPVIPSLTWTGEKLKPEWTAAFLAGEVKERPRPYLNLIRMPAFPARAKGLALGLSLEHGCPPASPPEPAPAGDLSEIGRTLSGPNGGLDCLSCHGIGEKKATKVFEAPAPNFRLARSRLRRDYFIRWLAEPLRLEPGTKMPQFFQQGKTQLTEILDGDAAKQMDALWQYLMEGEKIRPPGE